MASRRRQLARRVERLGYRLLCGLVPSRVRHRVMSTMFQPHTYQRRFDRLVHRLLNAHYALSEEPAQRSFVRQCWETEAGSAWIESKRARYLQGDMQRFLQRVRAPFVEMVMTFLRAHPEHTFIVEIGTGSGQLLFDLAEALPPSYRFVGIDMNRNAIQRNRALAAGRALAHRVTFEDGEACDWFQRQPAGETICVLSVAMLKFCTQQHVTELLTILRQKFQVATVAFLEDALSDAAARAESQLTGSLGFSHNYAFLLRQAAYGTESFELKQLDPQAPQSRMVYAMATARRAPAHEDTHTAVTAVEALSQPTGPTT